ncbi:asparagine synthase C-terminal domain-containing protein [Oceanotoga sp. DSM 15011]|uniref:asparagine synthase C-terminal domain-containing protein n=1 Tax=Oceanotoga sp. DSM 15011 TaxID=2984951 RepID=UPI0021F40CE7|nr:asparagine synthase C-terminal domain-containing protein [Oceanotoga sp. DSM 15011]UYO99170.1 asparagine synthase C-terminal domain-containing protein [Oceanotoga sp. DSM 15011]
MNKIVKIILDINNNRFNKVNIDKNCYIYIYKYMGENLLFKDLKSIKEKKIPYIYYQIDGENIINLEISTGIIRAIPIFYMINDKNELIISDDIKKVEKYKKNLKLKYDEILNFLSFGYALNKNTLLKNIFQIQAGEKLKCSLGEKISLENYFIYDFEKNNSYDREKYIVDFENILYKTFEEYLPILKNRKIIVPLSGGYDSRLIVSMLKEFDIKDVLCVSYGIKNNFETKKAKIVANELNYNLDIFEFELFDMINLYDDIQYNEYIESSSLKNSLAVSQEFLMVKYLIDKYNFDKNEIIFIPGHTGDFISGGHILLELLNNSNKENFKKSIYKKHSLRTNIKYDLLKHYKFYSEESYKNYEFFNWRERQSKFIVNANRNYDFNGYSWVIPFWYNDFVEFWTKVPLEYKFQKNLYDEYLEEILFKKYKIDFDKLERQKIRKKGRNIFFNKTKNILKKNKLILNLYKKLNLNRNPQGYDKMGQYTLKITEKKYPYGYEILDNILKKEFESFNRVNINAYPTEFYVSKLLEEYEIDEL